MKGRLLGIDYGEKRIGLAMSDPSRIIASPFEVLERREIEKDLAALVRIIDDECVKELVVGRPYHAHGDKGVMVARVEAFVNSLTKLRPLPVHWVDERYTSLEADEILRVEHSRWQDRKKKRDMVAAQIILRTFLESGGETI